MFCGSCGHQMTDQEKFCSICGTAASSETSVEEVATAISVSLQKEIVSKQPMKQFSGSSAIYCGKCGSAVEGNDSLCPNCATKVEQIPNENPYKERENPAPNSQLSKSSKIVMIVVAVLIIATVAAVQVGNSLSDPRKLVTRFKTDITTNNTSDLMSILYCNDARLTIDSKNVAPLLAYFKTNPSYFDEVSQSLNNDAFNPKDINSLSPMSSNTLTLANVGKKFFIFPTYKINIKPSFIDITTGVKDVTFSINNTQIGKSDTDKSTKEFGPYMPGNYSIVADYKGKYFTLSQPYPVDLVSASSGKAKLDVFTDMNYLNISADYTDAEIFVNGKDINVKVKDAMNLGPINSSAKIYATYVKDGKTLKSDEHAVSNGNRDLYLSFQYATNQLNGIQGQLKHLLEYYTTYFSKAINSNNASYINPYVAIGSDIYTAQQSYIPKTYAAGIREYIISANITNYTISDDNKSGSITTSEVYNITNQDGTSSNKAFTYVYKFIYNEPTACYQFTSIN